MRIWLVALLLGACTLQPPGGRDPEVPIGATTRFEPTRFAGTWVVRQGLAGQPAPGALQVSEVDPAGFTWREDGRDLPARITGTGRFTLGAGPGSKREVWVLWIDDGFRTAALGNPDGSLGLILDRQPAGGEDRIAAARAIMEFNGYDPAKLVDVTE